MSYNKDYFLVKKLKAIEYKGGKCKTCGYNKYYGALEFHHRNPSGKEFSWKTVRNKSWDIIFKELDKCDLLCCRCHREAHKDNKVIERAMLAIKGFKRKSKNLKRYNKICKCCNNKYIALRSRSKYCGKRCTYDSMLKIKYPNNLKYQLRLAGGQQKLAQKLGVSRSTIRRKLKFGV